MYPYIYIYIYICICTLCVFADCHPLKQMQCDSGECLNRASYCNGKVECRDGTDEPPHCRELSSIPTITVTSHGVSNLELSSKLLTACLGQHRWKYQRSTRRPLCKGNPLVWILLIKGQRCEKCFHAMAMSCQTCFFILKRIPGSNKTYLID